MAAKRVTKKSRKKPVPRKIEKPPTNCIRAWREFRGIKSQQELADKAGITRPTISRLESGSMPWRQWILERIAGVLDCTPAELISVNPYETPSVVQIYNRIPPDQKQRALNILKAFAEEAIE